MWVGVCRVIFCLSITSGTAFAHVANIAYIDIPLVFTTSYSAAMSTEIKAGVGLGWSHFPWQVRSLRLGYGANFTLSPLYWHGTEDVYAKALELGLELRGYLTFPIEGSNTSFWPYIFMAPSLDLRLTRLFAYATDDSVFSTDAGIRGGAGVKIGLGDLTIKIDGALGTSKSGLTVRTSIIFGLGIF